MILAIDMGNSNIVVGGLDDNKTYFEERITTDDRKTSLEYAILLKNILEIHKVKKNDIEGSIMASVVPPLNAPISSAVKKITGKKPLLVGSGMKTGLNIKMDNPKTVGGDRIVAAVAANAKYKGPIIIADMGTATTLDVVDHDGNYIGGVILPGVKVALNSLVSNTAQLPRISFDVPKRAIGKNTIECMRNGIMLGNAAMLDQPQNEQAEEAAPLTHEEELEKELEKAQETIDEQKDKYLRLSAEFDNYRKRTMKEKAELILNGGEKSLSSILPIVDDFERAIKTMETATDVSAVKEGVELIYNKFMAVLGQNGVKVIETKDQPLDTDYHEAIAVIPAPSEEQKGKILDCVQTGYTLNDKVLRHAKVVVGE